MKVVFKTQNRRGSFRKSIKVTYAEGKTVRLYVKGIVKPDPNKKVTKSAKNPIAQSLKNLFFIDTESLPKVFDKEKELLSVIDLRPSKAYKQDHMSMAINMPFDQIDWENIAPILEKKRTYLIYSNEDKITEKIATLLAQQDIHKVFALRGKWQTKTQIKKINQKAQLQSTKSSKKR